MALGGCWGESSKALESSPSAPKLSSGLLTLLRSPDVRRLLFCRWSCCGCCCCCCCCCCCWACCCWVCCCCCCCCGVVGGDMVFSDMSWGVGPCRESQLFLPSQAGPDPGSGSPLTSASPRILSDSATFSSGPICSCDTLISPLYMNSTTAFNSGHLMSLRITIGCWHGLSKNSDWKYGLQADRTILCALTEWPSQARVTSTKDSL